MILSILASLAATILSIVHMVNGKVSGKIISLMLIVTFVLALIGLAIFTDNKPSGHEYFWAYNLAWVTAVISLVYAIVVFVLCRKD